MLLRPRTGALRSVPAAVGFGPASLETLVAEVHSIHRSKVSRNDRPHPGRTAIELGRCYATFTLLILLFILIVIPCALKIKNTITIRIMKCVWLLNSTAVHPGPLPQEREKHAPR